MLLTNLDISKSTVAFAWAVGQGGGSAVMQGKTWKSILSMAPPRSFLGSIKHRLPLAGGIRPHQAFLPLFSHKATIFPV